MRRLFNTMSMQTPGEKLGTLDGTNLFFGALLGANLGTLNGVSLVDYAAIIFVLAGTVITLRVFSTSERRGYAYRLLAAYVGLVAYFLYGPGAERRGLSGVDRDHLAVTLAIWVLSVLFVELYPTRPAAGQADQAS